MIDYATYRRIHHLLEVDKLNLAQIARQLAGASASQPLVFERLESE